MNVEATIVFEVVVCCECHMAFGLHPYTILSLRSTHAWFHCPNGHTQKYAQESQLERARREKTEAENRLQAQLNNERHARLVSEKEAEKAKRKLRSNERRISAGVCTCCNRTFADLAQHMKTKHRDYGIAAGREPKKLQGVA